MNDRSRDKPGRENEPAADQQEASATSPAQLLVQRLGPAGARRYLQRKTATRRQQRRSDADAFHEERPELVAEFHRLTGDKYGSGNAVAWESVRDFQESHPPLILDGMLNERTMTLARSGSGAALGGAAAAPVQRRAAGPAASDEHVHEAAEAGIRGAGGSLPHIDRIQRSFGKHDVAHVKAHTDGAAAASTAAIGAEAFATGDHVAFAGTPSLHTAAHEAAHVVQQRSGVQLKGGVGEEHDEHERHADAVADQVVRGESSEGLLDRYAGAPAAGVQRKVVQRALAADREDLQQPAIRPRDGVPIGDDKKANAPGDDGKFVDGKPQAAPLAAASAVTNETDVLRLNEAAVSSLPDKPGGPGAKSILQKGFGGNWFKAKHVLLEEPPIKTTGPGKTKSVGTDKELRGRLMDKLIAMRFWESEGVLAHVRDVQLPADIPDAAQVEPKKRLEWDNSGSGNRTSDVDLALKGKYNRQAIGLFNKAFRMRGWGAEAGVVYDVNVYAQTFLGNEEDITVTDDKLKAPQLKGVKQERNQRDADLDQEAWSLVHTGRYMTTAEWEAYKTKAVAGLDGEAKSKMQAAILKADTRLRRYREELAKKRRILRLSASEGQLEAEMQVANRIYEEKLEHIIQLEQQLEALEQRAAQTGTGPVDPKLPIEIDKLTLTLREKYSESEMYSNESYITDGALNHVVMGLQKGTNEKFLQEKRGNKDKQPAKIQLSAEGFLQSFNEQVGDVCKELGRVKEDGSDLSHHVYQGGKYFFRMIDAAKRMFDERLPEAITRLPEYRLVEQVGTVAMTIKDKAKKAESEKGAALVDTDKETQTALAFVAGDDNKQKLATLRKGAIDLGIAVAREYKQQQNPSKKAAAT